MNLGRMVAPGACVAAVALTVSACTSTSGDTQGAADGAGVKTAKIAVIVPLGGEDNTEAVGIRNAAQLAVAQANAANRLPGWKLEVEALDDKGDEAQAKAMATKVASDDQVVAVVGSQFSSTTKAMLPVLAAAGIPTLSPSATNPALTKGEAYATAPKRPYANFFRVVASDDAQGPALATYLTSKNVTRVVAVHDGDVYGKGLYETFAKAYRGKIVSTEVVRPGKATDPAFVAKVVKAKPQAVFYGGWDTESGPMSLALKEAGLKVPVVGGDGMYTSAYIPLSGPISAGDIATVPGRPLESHAAGKTFSAAYDAADFAEGQGKFAGQGYDATNAVINAGVGVFPSVATPKEARARLNEAIGSVSFDGATGKVAFDSFGDITAGAVTVEQVDKGDWTAAQVVEG